MSKYQAVCEEITKEIIEEMKKGVLPWNKPWTGESPVLLAPKRHNGEYYRGINTVMLLVKAMNKGFASPYWMTFKQALELGGTIKKGEKSTKVFYASKLEVKDDTNEDETIEIPYMKVYNVFNADQIEGLEDKYYYTPEPVILNNDLVRNEQLDSFIDSLGIDYKYEGYQAYYSLTEDQITMPEFNSFKTAQGFYATFFHEITHWTGHKARCERDMSQNKASYAFEELIAELGAAFLCAYKGIQPNIREDHAPYIATWIKALEDDPKTLFKAATKAQEALDFIINLSA